MRKTLTAILALATAAALVPAADACTRILYQGADSSYYFGRTMDWAEDTGTDLWAFPGRSEARWRRRREVDRLDVEARLGHLRLLQPRLRRRHQ